MELFIVGKVLNYETKSWEFQGVFDSVHKATLACKDESYFIGPSQLNEESPDETVAWNGAYYPKL